MIQSKICWNVTCSIVSRLFIPEEKELVYEMVIENHTWIGNLPISKKLHEKNAVAPDIRLNRELAILDRFRGCPLHREPDQDFKSVRFNTKLSSPGSLVSRVFVVNNNSGKTKVCHLNHICSIVPLDWSFFLYRPWQSSFPRWGHFLQPNLCGSNLSSQGEPYHSPPANILQ